MNRHSFYAICENIELLSTLSDSKVTNREQTTAARSQFIK